MLERKKERKKEGKKERFKAFYKKKALKLNTAILHLFYFYYARLCLVTVN
jgi:hypothetical protein